VFYINYKNDEKLLEELRQHMGVLARRGLISESSAGESLAGDQLDQVISEQLSNADIIVPLVSAKFFSQKDCRAQIQRAVERHQAGEACVIPILLHPFLWEDEKDLKDKVILPRDANAGGKPKAISSWKSPRDEAFMSVVTDIRKVADRLRGGESMGAVVDNLQAIIAGELSASRPTEPAVAVDEQWMLRRKLIPYLCDRSAQDKGLEAEIKTWFVGAEAADSLRKPLVGIVQGDDQECLGMYKRRLMAFSLLRLLRADPDNPFRVRYLKLPTLVSKVEDGLADFLSELSSQLTGASFLSREQVAKDIAQTGVPVFIHSWLDTETWDDNTPEVIRTYLRFWHDLSPLPPASQLICCLFLKHSVDSAESEAGREKARQLIADLDLSPYSGARILKLPELAPVPRGEALDWLRDGMNFQHLCNRHPMEFCDTEGGEEYIREQIFESAKAVKQMKPLAMKLDTMIELYRCKR